MSRCRTKTSERQRANTQLMTTGKGDPCTMQLQFNQTIVRMYFSDFLQKNRWRVHQNFKFKSFVLRLRRITTADRTLEQRNNERKSTSAAHTKGRRGLASEIISEREYQVNTFISNSHLISIDSASSNVGYLIELLRTTTHPLGGHIRSFHHAHTHLLRIPPKPSL